MSAALPIKNRAMPLRAPLASGGATPALSAEVADVWAAMLTVATVTFNAGLAFVNGHVFGINNTVVIFVQAALIFAAMGVALLAKPVGIGRWIAFAWAMVLLNVVLMLFRSSFDPKPIGDVLVLPAFVLLGLCMKRITLIKTLIFLQVVLVIFVIWELFLPTSFGDFFKVRDYYVGTRGFRAESFWAGTDNLFLSSQRPGGRLLTVGFDINRGSSLFLEPVTLGNWTVVITVALATFWNDISRRGKLILIITNLLLIIGCDGRLALATNIVLLLTMTLSNKLPRFVPFLYLPALFLLLVTLTQVGILDTADGTDSTTGRYANSTMTFVSLSLQELFGLVATQSVVTADSGWAYICLKQSLFGLAALWVGVTLMVPGEKGLRFSHAAGVFMALGLPVSFSIVSIKMAATLWVIAGCASRELWQKQLAGGGDLPEHDAPSTRPRLFAASALARLSS